MPITHTQSCILKRINTYNYHNKGYHMRYEPVAINCSTLPASFSLCVNDQVTAYTLSWTAVEHALKIEGGSISVSGSGGAASAVDIWAGNFPPSPAGQLEIPFETFSSSLSFTISLDARIAEQAAHTLASRSAPSILQRSPNNSCFHFPRTSRQLWANADSLRKISPYYDSLLSFDFAEGSTLSQAVPNSSSLPEYTYDDSDAETDELELGCKAKSKKGEEQDQHEEQDQKKETDDAPFNTVTVVDTAYTTYFAVLVWLATGYIRFAPLRSKFKSDDRGAKQARATELDKMVNESDSQLPPPASPKSVYRLAHLLDLPELLQLALDSFKTQLSPANAMYELFSDVSCSYDAVSEVAVEFTAHNWEEVDKVEATREVERRMHADELPKGATSVALQLALKMTEE
ncbi:hypothetical protein JCM5296_006385 [Sporobolomyces johnsonii]